MHCGVLTDWLRTTPKIHLDVVTSLSTKMFRPTSEEEKDDYAQLWQSISIIPNLRKLSVQINDCGTYDDWYPESRLYLAGPIKCVQQKTLKKFDLIFQIDSDWFPDDCYLRINYNGLGWDTFLINREKYPAFKGIHPRCRMIGINTFLHDHPVRDDMPTQAQLIQWMYYFSCAVAYDEPDPDGYDWDEVGKSVVLARRKPPEEEADRDVDGPRDAPPMLSSSTGTGFRWKYPDRPSWIKHDTDRVV